MHIEIIWSRNTVEKEPLKFIFLPKIYKLTNQYAISVCSMSELRRIGTGFAKTFLIYKLSTKILPMIKYIKDSRFTFQFTNH